MYKTYHETHSVKSHGRWTPKIQRVTLDKKNMYQACNCPTEFEIELLDV